LFQLISRKSDLNKLAELKNKNLLKSAAEGFSVLKKNQCDAKGIAENIKL
jgi:hypothetical protein